MAMLLYFKPKSFLIRCSSPLPISFLPCIGRTVERLPSRTLRWLLPLPGSKEHPCCASHLFSSALVTIRWYNRSVVKTTGVLRWRGRNFFDHFFAHPLAIRPSHAFSTLLADSAQPARFHASTRNFKDPEETAKGSAKKL